MSEEEGSEEGADGGNEEDILCEYIKEEDQEDSEARVAKARGNTKEPTQKEIDEHTLTHIPFRSWCAHCVRGKAKNNPHTQITEDINATPTVSIDYMHMGEDEGKDKDNT